MDVRIGHAAKVVNTVERVEVVEGREPAEVVERWGTSSSSQVHDTKGRHVEWIVVTAHYDLISDS
jgi:hypothetical protein